MAKPVRNQADVVSNSGIRGKDRGPQDSWSQNGKIQEVLLRLIGATAAAASVPFLREMLRYTRRGDHLCPQRYLREPWVRAVGGDAN